MWGEKREGTIGNEFVGNQPMVPALPDSEKKNNANNNSIDSFNTINKLW